MENVTLTEETGSPEECKAEENLPQKKVEQEKEQRVLDLRTSEDQKPGARQPQRQ